MSLVLFIALSGLFAFALHALLRERVPATLLTVLVGFVASELATGAGVDLGLRWDTFADLIVIGALPILIFESAMLYDEGAARRRLGAILLLAGPLLLLAVATAATLMYALMDRPEIFDWRAAVYAGILLAAIDPLAANRLLRRFPAHAGSGQLLASEGLFNDALTVVLASVVISTADLSGPLPITLTLCWLVLGGALLGAAIAAVAVLASGRQTPAERAVVVTLFAAYGSFVTAEQLGLSGATAALVCGLLLRRRLGQEQDCRSLYDFWGGLSQVTYHIMFLLMGATITLPMFADRWLAMLIGIGAALAARLLAVHGALPVFGLLHETFRTTTPERRLLSLGGTRGAVTIALALLIPIELPWWYTVQSMAYGVVIFSLCIQLPWLRYVALPRS